MPFPFLSCYLQTVHGSVMSCKSRTCMGVYLDICMHYIWSLYCKLNKMLKCTLAKCEGCFTQSQCTRSFNLYLDIYIMNRIMNTNLS